MRKTIVAALLSAFAVAAAAEDAVYRYVDADGVVHYTDRAPDRHARPLRLGPVSGATSKPAKAFYSPEALRQAARFSVRIESPTPGQRLAPGTPAVVLAASVMPALVSGFHLVYQVDGKSVSAAPVDALSVSAAALPPGEHELVVVLLDARGQEITRSETGRFEIGEVRLAASAPKKTY